MTNQSHNKFMNIRSQKKQEKIDRILDHGIEAFREHGYHSSSVQDLADFCKISKGSFYQYFESKEHFCQEVIKHYSGRMNLMLHELFQDQSLSGLQRLELFYNKAIGMVSDSKFQTGCLYGDLAAELGGVNQPCSETLSKCLNSSLKIFELAIKDGQKDGSIRSDIDAETLSSVTFNSFTGIILRMKVERNHEVGLEFVNTYVKKLLASN